VAELVDAADLKSALLPRLRRLWVCGFESHPSYSQDSLWEPCKLSPMPTDSERWRFLADHGLTLHTDGGDYGYMVHWCKTAGPGQPPMFYPVSNGRTAEEAIDRAIARYNRKHGIEARSEPSAGRGSGVCLLPVRGWVT
jgi:hypothetical protein